MPHFSHLLIIGILAAVISTSVQARETCTVDHCHDGDTCTLVCAGERVKVRLHCIDAPEMAQESWGAQSRDHLRERATIGAMIDLVSVTRDKYRRTVGVLLRDGVNLSLNQVQAGWAAVYPKYCADPVYYQAQEDARAHGRGIWRVEGEQQQPWAWRHRSR